MTQIFSYIVALVVKSIAFTQKIVDGTLTGMIVAAVLSIN
jgi:hypothetical protein